MKKILTGFLALILLTACNNDNEENCFPATFTSIATVENPAQSPAFRFRLDNNELMWIQATNFPNYRPKTGQRIIANYGILSIAPDSASYNHKVSLYNVYEVLTKGIFKITPQTQDSIGNDPVEIREIWVGSNYLNIKFAYLGYNRTHFLNLVSDSAKTYTDGKVHLEFRHNANNDQNQYTQVGIVSFNLSSLQGNATNNTVNLVIHTREFGAVSEKTYNLTYKFGSAAGVQAVKEITIPQNIHTIK